ncbi:MAG: hypothetical protein H0W88_12600 [Parachlamydiaceae bacterium]|nr:hypothetical protein [Parachlamydiaceae bacterium]
MELKGLSSFNHVEYYPQNIWKNLSKDNKKIVKIVAAVFAVLTLAYILYKKFRAAPKKVPLEKKIPNKSSESSQLPLETSQVTTDNNVETLDITASDTDQNDHLQDEPEATLIETPTSDTSESEKNNSDGIRSNDNNADPEITVKKTETETTKEADQEIVDKNNDSNPPTIFLNSEIAKPTQNLSEEQPENDHADTSHNKDEKAPQESVELEKEVVTEQEKKNEKGPDVIVVKSEEINDPQDRPKEKDSTPIPNRPQVAIQKEEDSTKDTFCKTENLVAEKPKEAELPESIPIIEPPKDSSKVVGVNKEAPNDDEKIKIKKLIENLAEKRKKLGIGDEDVAGILSGKKKKNILSIEESDYLADCEKFVEAHGKVLMVWYENREQFIQEMDENIRNKLNKTYEIFHLDEYEEEVPPVAEETEITDSSLEKESSEQISENQKGEIISRPVPEMVPKSGDSVITAVEVTSKPLTPEEVQKKKQANRDALLKKFSQKAQDTSTIKVDGIVLKKSEPEIEIFNYFETLLVLYRLRIELKLGDGNIKKALARKMEVLLTEKEAAYIYGCRSFINQFELELRNENDEAFIEPTNYPLSEEECKKEFKIISDVRSLIDSTDLNDMV